MLVSLTRLPGKTGIKQYNCIILMLFDFVCLDIWDDINVSICCV